MTFEYQYPHIDGEWRFLQIRSACGLFESLQRQVEQDCYQMVVSPPERVLVREFETGKLRGDFDAVVIPTIELRENR